METTFQEIIYQLLILCFTGLISLVSYYVKSKIDIEKYGFDNDRFERVIDNGIKFAENKANEYSKNLSVKLDSKIKLVKEKSYNNDYISKKDINKYRFNIENMIKRKIQHNHNTSIKI